MVDSVAVLASLVKHKSLRWFCAAVGGGGSKKKKEKKWGE
jgi:hypothetical protein